MDVMGKNANNMRCPICNINFQNSGKALKADDKHFHAQCFKCKICNLPVKGKYRKAGNLQYECEACVVGGDAAKESMRNFLNETIKKDSLGKCKKCGKDIFDQVATAQDKTKYHYDCFVCDECQKNLAGKPYASDDKGAILCEDCVKKYQQK